MDDPGDPDDGAELAALVEISVRVPERSPRVSDTPKTPTPLAPIVPPAPVRRAGLVHGVPSSIAALVAATVVVDALSPLLQERASKVAGFDSSSMVVAETMSYYLGGLSVAVLSFGPSGFRRCIRPMRYLAFLPASFAFSASNFLTYVAVRGLGASQFYLLAQLRIAILAVVQRLRTGTRQPTAAWIALVQLATGMVTLVWYKSNNAATTAKLVAVAGCGSPGMPSTAAVAADRLVSENGAEFIVGMLALLGVVVSSAFGFLYLEWQLKLHAQDPIFIQLHQMNSFGAGASLLIFHHHHHARGPAEPQHAAALSGLGLGLVNATSSLMRTDNASFAAHLAGLPSPTAAAPYEAAADDGPGYLQILTLLSCIISRGVLSGSVLKQLDSIAKGLIDVTAIVLCTCLQISFDPSTADGTILGTQFLMLLSIVSYQHVRAHPQQSASQPFLELPKSALLSAPVANGRCPDRRRSD